MSIRPSLVMILMTGLTTLGGCALFDEPGPDAPPLLTSPDFEARINQLENTLSSRCDANLAALLEQRDPELISTEVAALGGQVRGMRKDLEQLGSRNQQDAKQEIVNCPSELDPQGGKTVLGRSEWVGLPTVGTFLEARIDTGAKTSSLSARDITPFERDGEDWVRFKLGLNDTDEAVKAVRDSWIEAPVMRRVKIIQANGEASRPVIRQLMTLGPIRQHVEFTLNDRTHLDYPVLLGRRFLLDIAVVDVARQHVHEQPTFAAPAEAIDADTTDDKSDSTPTKAGDSDSD